MFAPSVDGKQHHKDCHYKQNASGKFYISILVKYENQIFPIIPKNFLGLDFAMHGLYVASDEDNANYPNFLRKAEKKLAKAQRRLSKRQEGSRNRDKQRIRVAILHEKIANQRRDFMHKKADISRINMMLLVLRILASR